MKDANQSPTTRRQRVTMLRIATAWVVLFGAGLAVLLLLFYLLVLIWRLING